MSANPFADRPAEGNQDRAVGRISFKFFANGREAWASGEYETFVHHGEAPEAAMMRASDNALTIAFETRDSFIRQHKEH
jgi:hypothetical protein